MTTHELKCWPEFFRHIVSGEKTFEVRKDDRGFRAGDDLHLREWLNDGTGYTGREITVRVTYLLAGKPWLEKDYVVMGFQPHKSCTCQRCELCGNPAPDGYCTNCKRDVHKPGDAQL